MKKQSRRSAQRNSQRPVQISSNIVYHHLFRFTSAAAGNHAITDTMICNVTGALAVSAISAWPISGSARITNVEIWTPPASQGSPATCSVEWVGQNNSPPKEVSDTTVSVSSPAHIVSKPPAQSLASFWLVPTATRVMTIVAPVGSIIDVSVSFVLRDGVSPGDNVTALVTTGATVGALYYPPLDRAAAGGDFQPVSLTPLP